MDATIIGVVLGVVLLGDSIRLSPTSLAVEALCLLGLVASVVLIGRSPALLDHHQRADAVQPSQGHQQAAAIGPSTQESTP